MPSSSITRALRLLAALAPLAWLLAATPAAAQGTLRGWLHVVWDDDPGERYWLVEPDGRATELLFPARAAQADPLRLDRSFVEVSGRLETTGERRRLLHAEALRPSAVPGGAAPRTLQQVSPGPDDLPFITLLCRYADDPSTPSSAPQIAAMMGGGFPGVGHFYGEVSGIPGVMAANVVSGWYDLPLIRSQYITFNNTATNTALLAQHCAAAA
ncbi:MAG TPA: hypothetical protein VFX98_08735, partial [Longimicrobiaceae bacterium]|nr:hypothetical protein [Longimicrobiaceae bacterium]